MIACPYCGAAQVEACDQGLFDLAAKALGEARRALEARALGLPLRDVASVLVSGESIEGATLDRRCPYCRSGLVSVSTRKHLAIDLSAFALGFARLYWVSGGGRRLRLVELGTLVLDGRLRELEGDEGEGDEGDEGEEANEAPPVEPSPFQASRRRGPVGTVRVIDVGEDFGG